MVTWAEAHRLAIASSMRVLKATDWDVNAPVSLLDVAERDGVVVRYAPLPSLAGAYVAGTETSPPGIMINTRLPWAKQRFTLGHELGHHYFGHGSQTDLETDWLAASARGPSNTNVEKLAEAFAAWIAMPRANVESARRRLGIGREFRPVDVYRMSLLLGASYRAVCVHLTSLRWITWPVAQRLLEVTPKSIKSALIGGGQTSVGAADIHIVIPAISRYDVRSGDLLVLGRNRAEGDLPRLIGPARASGGQCVLVVQQHDVVNPVRPCTIQPLVTSEGLVEIVIHHELHGVSEAWFA